MAELFSADWMRGFMARWNAEPGLADALAEIGFNSVIGYGFPGDDAPKGVMTVENGKVVSAGEYAGETLNWDMRASADQWQKWIAKPPGMMGIGSAFAMGKLKFEVGDYSAMVKDPRMAGPFIKSFAVMSEA